MKIAVFGANGQLGRCFQDIKARDKSKGYRFYKKPSFDISDPRAYLELNPTELDVLINCAAYTAVDKAESDRELAYMINVTGAKLLADFGVLHNIPLVHISTDYIYGQASQPIRESHEISPVNYYGQTKWEGEQEIQKSGVSYLILRTSWLYAEYGHNFVKTMLKLAENQTEIKVVNDQTGSPTYAADLASAIDHILYSVDDVEKISWGTYNFSNKGAITWYEFALGILKNRAIDIKPISTSEYPAPAKRPSYTVLDTSLFEEVFDWKIPDWRNGLERCMRNMELIHGNLPDH